MMGFHINIIYILRKYLKFKLVKCFNCRAICDTVSQSVKQLLQSSKSIIFGQQFSISPGKPASVIH